MSCRKQSDRKSRQVCRAAEHQRNKVFFKAVVDWLIPMSTLFTKDRFHGNTKWEAESVVKQALIWSWQEVQNVTDAFEITSEICEDLNLKDGAKNYTAFMNALTVHRKTFLRRVIGYLHALAENVGGRFYRDRGWVLMAFDGSRASTPRSMSNEEEFCAANYGKGKTAKYRKKKSKGQRRKKNKKNPAAPPKPQPWITLLWHMSLRLPWMWRLGASDSSERGHVTEMLQEEDFPENTLFCGDAGFVGYDFWKGILDAGHDFLVRVGGNVHLLSDTVDVERQGKKIVLCWPKDKMNSGDRPLTLRLIQVTIGTTKMWMLTSVLDRKKLPVKKIVKYYKMLWGIEVAFRGLKQITGKGKLRCKAENRVYAELDWSLLGMAFAELVALREQIPQGQKERNRSNWDYDTKDRSLANTMRALRKCMRNLHKYAKPGEDLYSQLSRAVVQKYNNRTDKKARYRPKNPDKKKLGEPKIREMTPEERQKLRKLHERIAA